MPAGVDTSPEVVAKFRAHYLYSGNAAESARAVGIPESTGRDVARRLVDDPEFVSARRDLRATALEELVAMRMRVATTALDRFENGPEDVSSKGDNVTIIDKRPDYGKLVIDAEKNAHALAKAERDATTGENAPQAPAEVTINIHGPASIADGGS